MDENKEKYPLNEKLDLFGYIYRTGQILAKHGLKLLVPVFIWLFFAWSNLVPNILKPTQHISIDFYSTVVGTLTKHYTNDYNKVAWDEEKEGKLLDINKELISKGDINKAIEATLSALLRSNYHLGLTIVSYVILTGSFIITNLDRQIIILLVTLQIISSYQPQSGIKSMIIGFLGAIKKTFTKIIQESGDKIKTSILVVGAITFLLYRFHSLALVGFSYTLLAGALFFSWLDYLVILLLISYQTLIIFQILTKYSYAWGDLLRLINESGGKILALLAEKTRACFKTPIFISFCVFSLIITRASNPDLVNRNSTMIFYVWSGLIWIGVLSWLYGIYIMIKDRRFFEIEYIVDNENDDYEPYELAKKLISSHATGHMFFVIFGGLAGILFLYYHFRPTTVLGELCAYIFVSLGITVILIINGIRYTNLKEMFLKESGTKEKMKWFFQSPIGIK